jgi:hypothetical protein
MQVGSMKHGDSGRQCPLGLGQDQSNLFFSSHWPNRRFRMTIWSELIDFLRSLGIFYSKNPIFFVRIKTSFLFKRRCHPNQTEVASMVAWTNDDGCWWIMRCSMFPTIENVARDRVVEHYDCN